jgi:ATP-dependent DNA helicase RecG
MSETNRIEYKQKLTDGLEKEVVAFLNYREGGAIYVGIDKSGNVTGVDDLDRDMIKIKDRLKNNISPSAMGLFDVAAEHIEDKDVIKITVASGSEKPYYIKKYGMSERGCYIRIGTAAEPMTSSLIEGTFSRRVRNSLKKIESYRQDLTFEQLKIYYQEKKLTLGDQFASNLELLTNEEKFNYVGYMMADRNGTSIKVAKWKGEDRIDLVENEEYGYECLIKSTKSVLDKLELENTTYTQKTTQDRNTRRLWDADAVREAVINAIVHNDYTDEVPPKFEIFSDRLEITSTGILPERMSQEDFFRGISKPKNKEIMRIFRDVELVEHLGSGIPRILKSYNRDCFIFMDNFIRMSFPKSEGSFDKDKGDVKGDVIGDVISELLDLTPRQKEVLTLIINDGRISYKKLGEELGVGEGAIKKHIKHLKARSYIKRVGGTRGYWEITINKN